MSSAVKASSFVRKDKNVGSWDPNSAKWEEKEYSFTQKSWGIKANMEQVPASKEHPQPRIRFTYPLNITEVRYQSEADTLGLRVSDVIVAVKRDSAKADEYIDVVPEQDLDARQGSKQYVVDSVRDILMAGGLCSVKVKREWRHQRCESCGSDRIIEITELGDLTCEDCGVVHRSRLISMASEWRTFADDDNKNDPNRTGGPENPLLSGDGMQTMIQSGGGRMAADQLGTGANLSKSQYRSGGPTNDRLLQEGYSAIQSMVERLNLNSNISMEAKELYKAVEDERQKGIKVGKDVEAILASVVFLACRIKNVPRTIKEMLSVVKCTKHDLGRTLKVVTKIVTDATGKVIPTFDAKNIVERFCSSIGASHTVSKAAEEIVENVNESPTVAQGRVQASIAGAAIYMACLLREGEGTKSGIPLIAAVSSATGAAEATIRDVFKGMYVERHKLVPEWYANKEQLDSMLEH
uniref:Transcription initiation factor IIB n=1 Tax=Hemiselmis andersenii TaxID=464988 RepID=A0A6U4KEN1_HEMAN